MGGVLILSSLVAASEVGGGYQALTLAALETRAFLVPTVLFGRHPGLGPPGGGATPDEIFEGMLRGVADSGALSRLDAVLCGYFASPAQVRAAAAAIDAARAGRREVLVVVDPIMGDEGKGLYVKAEVAEAVTTLLAPRAGVLTPNTWELARLSGRPIADAGSALAAARSLGLPMLVSSIPLGGGIGVLWVDGEEAWLASHARAAEAVSGAGDLLAGLFTAALVGGAGPVEALETAVGDVAARVLGGDPTVFLEALR